MVFTLKEVIGSPTVSDTPHQGDHRRGTPTPGDAQKETLEEELRDHSNSAPIETEELIAYIWGNIVMSTPNSVPLMASQKCGYVG